MEIIDARGLECPKPIILAENALSRIQEGTLTIIVDNESAAANLQKYADRFSYYCEIKQEENYWKVTIVKGYTCQISTIEKQIKKNLLVIISSDTIGKDEALGRILMKSFFETIIVTGQIPQMIFLMNTAVKLSTVDEEFIPILKKIEEMGTEIFTCGTCLKYYKP